MVVDQNIRRRVEQLNYDATQAARASSIPLLSPTSVKMVGWVLAVIGLGLLAFFACFALLIYYAITGT
jgi:hypothetical protein